MKSCCDNPACTAPFHKIGTNYMYHRKKCRCIPCTAAAAEVRNKGGNVRRPPKPPAMETLDWQERAACIGADINIFFPYDETNMGTSGASVEFRRKMKKEADSYCDRCEVKEQCLQQGLNGYERGIWGGTDHRERAAMRRAVLRNEDQPSEEVLRLRSQLVRSAEPENRKLMELTVLVANAIDGMS